uniref:DHHA1 domain-containing protein n=1 Tax=Leucobacter sp. BZR 635 TaxID=3378705 RepID=UPI003A875C78
LREKLGSEPGVVMLAGTVAGDGAGKPVVIAATTAGAREIGIKAGDLAKRGAQVLGGGGGGKPDLAQGGGTDPAQISAALAEMRRSIEA